MTRDPITRLAVGFFAFMVACMIFAVSWAETHGGIYNHPRPAPVCGFVAGAVCFQGETGP